MTKNSFVLLVVILVIGFAVWFSRFGKELKKTQDIVNEQQQDTKKILRRQVAAVPEGSPSPNATDQERLREDINALSNQLLQENQKLESQRQYLEKLKNQTNPQQTDLNYSSQIRSTEQEIQYLNDVLRGYTWNEGDLSRQANLALQEQNSSLRFYQEQADQNINQQEALIKQTQDEITYWQGNYAYVNEREERLQYFENLLAEQSQQLEGMKVQKMELAARALEQTQNVQNQVRQVASDTADNRQDIQDEITSLRQDIQRLEYAYSQSRMTQMSMQNQLQQAEKNIQGQQEVIRTIQELLREKQGELKSLQ